MEGSPCAATDRVNVATAVLHLYNAGEPATAGGSVQCDNTSFSADAAQVEPRALTDVVCGRLNVTDLGDSSLFIMSTQLTRKLPGSAAELLCEAATGETDYNGVTCVGDARNVMFAPSATGLTQDSGTPGAFIKFADSSIKLFADDAFAEITYTIFWEQRLGSNSRRLLRSDMVLGAGGSSTKAALKVLPIAEQIEDAVESLDSEPAATNTTEDTTEDEDEDTSTGMIVGIVAAAAAVVALAGWGYMKSQDKKGEGKGFKDPEKAGYKKVRRSERFSTMNF